jgi:cardiolipin synthase
MIVDGAWSLVGSANWDARSLRLNFEFNLEVYDRQLATDLLALVSEKIRRSSRLLPDDIDNRAWIWRVRDNIARLATPYL